VKASNTGAFDNFGISVSFSADGNTLAVRIPCRVYLARYHQTETGGATPVGSKLGAIKTVSSRVK